MVLKLKSPISEWTAENADKIVEWYEIIEQSDAAEVRLDLSDVKLFHPFGINFLKGLGLLCSYQKGIRCWNTIPKDKKAWETLKSIGFIDLWERKDNAELLHKGTETFQIQWMKNENNKMAGRIAEAFTSYFEKTKEVKASFTFSMNELMLNVFYHSESAIGSLVCAQAYPRQNIIRACLMDFGIGIRKSLEKNSEWKRTIDSDLDAVSLSLFDRVSSIEASERGLGLHLVEKFLMENGGELIILSGRAFLKRSYRENKLHEEEKKIMEHPFKGTGIEMVVNTKQKNILTPDEEKGKVFN